MQKGITVPVGYMPMSPFGRISRGFLPELRPLGLTEHQKDRGGMTKGEQKRRRKALATLIVASLEGTLMMRRLQWNNEALRRVQSHLNQYLENEVAAAR